MKSKDDYMGPEESIFTKDESIQLCLDEIDKCIMRVAEYQRELNTFMRIEHDRVTRN